MGQTYYPVNLDKREYLHPAVFEDGMKLVEFGFSEMGTMAGLALLLADGNGHNGGDVDPSLKPVSEIIGRWVGDRVILAGEYAEAGKFITKKADRAGFTDKHGDPIIPNVYKLAQKRFTNISVPVIFALMVDEDVRKIYKRTKQFDPFFKDFYMIHEKLAFAPGDLVTLVGRLKSTEGKTMLEKLLR
jgi:hypothetical protein